MGFASVLRELDIGSIGSGAVVPLLASNLGGELDQVAIALFLFLAMRHVQRLPHVFPHFAACSSALVMLAGGYWLLARTVT